MLAAAGGMTTGMLRAALRRVVIAADPAGAEERRKAAERRAKVVLYPDEESTATLAGQRLPVIHAAAAMARIKAMARAMKASGAGGPMDLLCAQVYIGLLLGTLPLIPPAEGAPPDNPPPGDTCDDRGSHGDDTGEEPPGDDGPGHADAPHGGGPDDEMPPPGDADAPRGEDDYPCPDDRPAGTGWDGYGQGDDGDDGWPAGDWPGVPAVIPAAFTRPGNGQPPGGGMLDLSLPWQTLAGISSEPGRLGRIGPVTAAQARHLAGLAALSLAAE